MKVEKAKGMILLFIFLAAYVAFFPTFEQARRSVRSLETRGMTFPPVVIKLLSLEFRSIAADFLFVRVSQFYGGKVARREEANQEDWKWLYRNLDVITELDPYFEDPYQLGNALLTWDAGMFRETNNLLQKGVTARSWDWQLPFFIGFNKFYFLNENESAADYLLLASKRPGAWDFLPQLASRLYKKAGRTEAAIIFLINFWKNEKDPRIKREYEIRIDALKGVLDLEKAVAQYRKRTGKNPANLNALVQTGVVANLPRDPYGGVFFLDKDGSVSTTSNFAFARKPSTGGP